jgi:hypothetical protein
MGHKTVSDGRAAGGGRGRPSFVLHLSSGGSSRLLPDKMVVVTKKYCGSNKLLRSRQERPKWQQQQQQEQSQSQSQSPPRADAYRCPPGDRNNGNNGINISNNNISNVLATTAIVLPSVYVGGGDGGGEDAYSVGEDTAMMLYPNINCNQGHSMD